LILKPTDYQFSKQWRQQAERDRIAAGGQGLSEAEISDFVDYFWKALHPKLFVDPLLAAGAADWVFEFGIDRQLTRVTRSPGSYLNFGHPII
jgi:D-glycerate 3-kinase